MEPYRSLQPNARLWLTETERVAERVLVLPTGTALTTDSVRRVCDLIRRSVSHAPAIRHRLTQTPAVAGLGGLTTVVNQPDLPV